MAAAADLRAGGGAAGRAGRGGLADGLRALLGAGLVVAVLLAVRGWMEWTRLRRRHAENCALLAELERTYGAALPWVQVENHFAELEAIRREQAERRHGP
ncbi:MAG: hypothetical protein WDO13_12250 [Verrucomicrobiota bacterium]